MAGLVVKFLRAQERQGLAALGRAAGSIIADTGTILVGRAA
jgi:hypothetical protein